MNYYATTFSNLSELSLPWFCSASFLLACSLYLVFRNDNDFRGSKDTDSMHLPINFAQLEDSIDLQKLVAQKYFKKKVPSCGFLDVIIATPNSGKHINKQSLVPTFPIQRYCVQDLYQDICLKKKKIGEAGVVSQRQTSMIQQQESEIQILKKKLQEEEKIRFIAENKVVEKRRQIDETKRLLQQQVSDANALKSELVQFTQEIDLLKEAREAGTFTDQLKEKIQAIETDLKHDEILLTNLRFVNEEIRKENEAFQVKKEQLLEQIEFMKSNPNMIPLGLNVNEDSDKSEESKDNAWVDVPLRRNSSSLKNRGRVNSVYGVSVPSIYIRLDSSVVNSPTKGRSFREQYERESEDEFSCSGEGENINIPSKIKFS